MTTPLRLSIRKVRLQTTDFGFQQAGDPRPIELELEEGEQVLYIESSRTARSLSDLADVAIFWIGRPL